MFGFLKTEKVKHISFFEERTFSSQASSRILLKFLD